MHRSPWPILLLALFIGLVYVFLVPPWQHYDEPNHFEYVWLIAHRPGWPQEGDFDRDMRVATLQSMIEHDFFRGMDLIPDADAEEPWIGPVPQIGDSPLYYWLAALPLRLFSPLEVTAQLYAARLISLLLFLGTIFLAWITTGLLVSENSPLRWMVPAFAAALPAFVDIMTAVNNDVAAIAAFSVFLYAATHLIVRGWRWQQVFVLFLAGGLCVLAKRTVFSAVALIPVVLLFAIFQGKKQRWAWLLIAVSGTLAMALSFRDGDAANWYRRTPQQPVTRSITTETPNGSTALHLYIESDDPTYQLLQLLPTETVPELAGQPVTLGAWMWSSAPVNMRAPRIIFIGESAPPLLQGETLLALNQTPRFYSWTFSIPKEPHSRAWVQFGPAAETPSTPVDVFIGDSILAVGDFSTVGVPQWQDGMAQFGNWGGQTVENLLRGSSARSTWINPRPWADDAWSRVFGYSNQRWASFIFYTLRDWPGAGWYYRVTSATLFRTFWAVFGWGHVKLLGSKPYRWLFIVTIALLIGAVWGLWNARRSLRWNVITVYALASGMIWGLTTVRGAHHVLSAFISIPVARYAFPALFPIALLFAVGANSWQQVLARIIKPLQKVPGLIWGLFLAGLTIWAWVSIFTFYN